ncbi:PcfB family protein [Listeria booriae]|uniref:PcfB family protein n=1 Tax=Listeria booriae TaxID=1552123 RepID=A0A841XSF5_9LIST|nr:PcfB family protein [Listeria booriae]MBC1318074.1 PcfB family protein [Listeria booriae]
MQEEINHKTIALSINTTKMSARTLKKALSHFLKMGGFVAKKNKLRSQTGKQSLKKLMKQNTGLSNVEITDDNIGSFKRVARKYGLDFALKKDNTAEASTYLVYFKGRDVDVMTQAFKEYTQKHVKSQDKPSIIDKLQENQVDVNHSFASSLNKALTKEKSQGLER